MYNIILINKNNIIFTRTKCYFFVNTEFSMLQDKELCVYKTKNFVSVNKRRYVILFLLLIIRIILLHLQGQDVTFL